MSLKTLSILSLGYHIRDMIDSLMGRAKTRISALSRRRTTLRLGDRKRFLRHLYDAITTAAASRGLKRVERRLIYRKPLGPDCFAWLGLNSGDYAAIGFMEIFPIVGVLHRRLEMERASLLGCLFDETASVSLSIHLGYVMPSRQARRYKLLYDELPDPMVAELFDDIDKNAEAFWARVATLEGIVAAWEQQPFRPFSLTGSFDRLPIAYALLGRNDNVIDLLTKRRQEMARWPKGPSEEFCQLALSLERQIRGGQ